MYVKLVSSDNHEFIVKRDHALTSGTIKAMLSGPGSFEENETNEINFREIPYVSRVPWLFLVTINGGAVHVTGWRNWELKDYSVLVLHPGNPCVGSKVCDFFLCWAVGSMSLYEGNTATLMGRGRGRERERENKHNDDVIFYRSHVLQKVCMYFTYKVRFTNSSTEIPEFPIAPEIALELLMAANFLDC